ncbi:unnamed protein product [Dibothriocephalus latus]|uniref:Major facilitator superfamily (MFS) profile domain-containing protein n=1 Tax=Dibothriocephalus latus TaxID=60516 RepID=A0A3P6T9C2_DIBLA|nr:unnamed protein product [Dibothriocephalus latus]
MPCRYLKQAGCTIHLSLVLWAALCICFMIDGCAFNIGIFISLWLADFNVTRFQLDFIGSIQLFTTYCLGPFTGALIERFGISAVSLTGALLACLGHLLTGLLPTLPTLFLCFGAMSGCGYGMLYLSAIVSVTTSFDELRPLAMGIMACGSGLGSSAFSLAIPLLEAKYSWKGACIIIAGLLLNCCVFGVTLSLSNIKRPPPPPPPISMGPSKKSSGLTDNLGFLGSGYLQLPAELGGTPLALQSQADLKAALVTPKMQNMLGSLGSFSYLVEVEKLVQANGLFGKGQSLWENRSFIMYLTGLFCYALGSLSPVILFYDNLLFFGISPFTAATIMSCCGISNAVARLVVGSIVNVINVKKDYLLGSIIITMSLVHVSFCFNRAPAFFYPYSAAVGICLGGSTVLSPLVVADLVQVERLTEAMSYQIMALGLGFCLSTPMATLTNDLLESRCASYLASAGLLILSGVLIIAAHFLNNRLSDDDVERLRRRLEAALS